MKKIFLIILISIFYINISSAQNINTFSELRNTVEKNREDIKNLNSNLETTNNNLVIYRDTSNALYQGSVNLDNNLSNQISSTNNLIAILSFLFTIVGILLGVWIEKRYQRIKDIQEIINSTKDYIDKHNTDLYRNLKEEENKELLLRLIKIPEDINNLITLLLSRKLSKNDFKLLLEAYKEAKKSSSFSRIKDSYLMLFAQHFPYESLTSPDLKDVMVEYHSLNSVDAMFWNDIEEYTKAIFKYSMETEDRELFIKLVYYIYKLDKFKKDPRLSKLFLAMKKDLANFNETSLTGLSIEKEEGKSFLDWINTFNI